MIENKALMTSKGVEFKLLMFQVITLRSLAFYLGAMKNHQYSAGFGL
jgi:hypothetical protein